MIKIENFEVMGWEHVIRGMRNPMNSWNKSDSGLHCGDYKCSKIDGCDLCCDIPHFYIGPNDHELMIKLRNAGTDHRKFMRMITVYVDITAPLYWWKEFDTYKVGTVANSCSTMHKIHEKEFALEDFSCEQLFGIDTMNYALDSLDYECSATHPCGLVKFPSGEPCPDIPFMPLDILNLTIQSLNRVRNVFLKTKDKKYWWQMIQLLPSSYNQKRTVMLNYEVLANMYRSRKNHKLDEWRAFCDWIETLPYSELITGEKKERVN